MSCSLQNSKIHWEAGTGRQKWIPPENKRRGGDGTWDVKSTWRKQEEVEEVEEEEVEAAVENKREVSQKREELLESRIVN